MGNGKKMYTNREPEREKERRHRAICMEDTKMKDRETKERGCCISTRGC